MGSKSFTRSPETGLITQMNLGNISQHFSYSAGFGELSGISARYSGSDIFKETITRDNLGRVSTRAEQYLGGSINLYGYTYDITGRLTAVTLNGSPYSSYLYDSNNNRIEQTIQGNTQSGIVYDEQDRLITFGPKNYSYNTNGDLTSVSFSSNSQPSFNLFYDILGVPSSVQIPSKAIEKSLIAYNRRTEKKNSKSLGPISLATTTEENFVTDNSTTQTSNFYYDVFGNLKSVILPTKTIEYGVDAHNRRMVKKVNGLVENYYLWGKDNQLLAVMNSSGVVTSSFVYGSKPHIPDYMIKDSVEYQIISNHLGSPVVVIDSGTGNVAQKITYDEFGNILSDTAPGFTPFGFAGCLYDVDTKLCRFGARDYDASIGRWLSKDPILFDGGDSNLYGYVFQDPINAIDFSGLSKRDVEQMRADFNSAVANWTSMGLRHSNGYINNIGQVLGNLSNNMIGNCNYLGCYEQAYLMQQLLQGKKYDDKWTFTEKGNGLHYWIEGRSNNPSDPKLSIDPWSNDFKECK